MNLKTPTPQKHKGHTAVGHCIWDGGGANMKKKQTKKGDGESLERTMRSVPVTILWARAGIWQDVFCYPPTLAHSEDEIKASQ